MSLSETFGLTCLEAGGACVVPRKGVPIPENLSWLVGLSQFEPSEFVPSCSDSGDDVRMPCSDAILLGLR